MREPPSDSVVTLVVGASAAIIVTSLLLLLLMIIIRFIQSVREEQRRSFIKTWSPIMALSIEETITDLPILLKFNYINFLSQWNIFADSVRGPSRKGLIRLAKQVGMERVAAEFLSKRSEYERTIGAMSLGNMEDKSQWDKLQELAENNIGLSGQVAARSLARIDPVASAPVLVPIFVRRKDWSSARVALILKDMEPNAVSIHLAAAIFTATSEDLPRLLRFLPYIERGIALQVLSDILSRNTEPEVLTACLAGIKALGDYQSISLVKQYINHEAWSVRVQAVNALGMLASKDDLPLLVERLSDQNWWVRYRSAQAICNAPFVTPGQLQEFRDKHPDRYARDILAQVLAEKQMVVD